MSHPLDGIRAKLDRGEEHLERLRDETREFFGRKEPSSYDLADEYNPETGRYRIEIRVLEEPPRFHWGLLAGEFAHHFRSALDHLIWQLVLADGRDPRPLRTQFPIHSDEDEFIAKVEERAPKNGGPLAGFDISGPVWALIKDAQPYKRPDPSDYYLSSLSFLDNEDKHKGVNVVFAIGEMAPTHRAQLYRPITLVPVIPPTLKTKITRTGPTPLEDGATFFDIQVLPPYPPKVKMNVEGDLFVRVGFGDSPERDPVSVGHMRHIAAEVRSLIDSFSPHLKP